MSRWVIDEHECGFFQKQQGTPPIWSAFTIIRILLIQDVKSRFAGAGSIDKLRTNSNPAWNTAGLRCAQPAAWPTDSKCRNLKILKRRDYNQLNLFNFLNLFLVSFGTVWEYMILTGTIGGTGQVNNSNFVFAIKLVVPIISPLSAALAKDKSYHHSKFVLYSEHHLNNRNGKY
jgi:hypothetical protein